MRRSTENTVPFGHRATLVSARRWNRLSSCATEIDRKSGHPRQTPTTMKTASISNQGSNRERKSERCRIAYSDSHFCALIFIVLASIETMHTLHACIQTYTRSHSLKSRTFDCAMRAKIARELVILCKSANQIYSKLHNARRRQPGVGTRESKKNKLANDRNWNTVLVQRYQQRARAIAHTKTD